MEKCISIKDSQRRALACNNRKEWHMILAYFVYNRGVAAQFSGRHYYHLCATAPLKLPIESFNHQSQLFPEESSSSIMFSSFC